MGKILIFIFPELLVTSNITNVSVGLPRYYSYTHVPPSGWGEHYPPPQFVGSSPTTPELPLGVCVSDWEGGGGARGHIGVTVAPFLDRYETPKREGKKYHGNISICQTHYQTWHNGLLSVYDWGISITYWLNRLLRLMGKLTFLKYRRELENYPLHLNPQPQLTPPPLARPPTPDPE